MGTTLGTNFQAKSRQQIQAEATPPSGRSQEAIWHQVYDTQLFVDNSTTRLTFFSAVQADKTLSNMPAAGMFPAPQSFQIHNVCMDAWTALPLSTAAGGAVGDLNDLALIMFVGRPTWQLNISDKTYGPYKLTTLHGTGGPTGFGWGTFTAEESLQYARNEQGGGWNYFGKVAIPEQVAFNMELNWAAVQDITADWRIAVSLFGVLNRRVL